MKQSICILSFIFSFLLFYSSFAHADSVEIWECVDVYDNSHGKIIVRAIVEKGREKGTIEAAGVQYPSHFAVEGFNRRWDFGRSNKNTKYAFIIEPNGRGLYYELNKVKPSMTMQCRQSK